LSIKKITSALFGIALLAPLTAAAQTFPSLPNPYDQYRGLGTQAQQQQCTAEQRMAGTCKEDQQQSSSSPINVDQSGMQLPNTVIPVIRNDINDRPASANTSGNTNPDVSDQSGNEFQDLVTLSVGRKLPIFGFNLFRHVPTTFAPIDRVPVPADYQIASGDEIFIRAWGSVDISYRAIVDRNGDIYIPRVGQIHLDGVRYRDLYNVVNAGVAQSFRNYQLSVSIGQTRSIQIFVVGNAKRPGSFTVSSLSTLLNALFATGGPTIKGSLRNIELRRGDQVVSTFDLYDLLLRGDKSKDVALQPGDVIYIPPASKLAAVAGSVNNPAIYEVKDDTTLNDLLNYAGGLSTTAAGQTVLVERITDKLVRSVDQFTLDAEGLRRKIKDGDLVNVLPLSKRFDNAITLRGNVAVPGRYPYHEGMKVKDLIPDRQALITNQYWLNQQALLNPERMREEAASRTAVNSSDVTRAQATPQPAAPTYTPPGTVPQATTAPAPQISVPSQSSGSAQFSIPSISPQYPATASSGGVGIDRGVTVPLRTQESLTNEIHRTAPDINWEYAVIQRLNQNDLTSELIPFNLRRAIDEPTSDQNITLKPGDVVTIFSQADLQVPIAQQSKFVRIEGEVKQAGVYRINPGETLRQLVARIGLSDRAYLFGSVFTRESTRIAQQRKMDEAVNRLALDVERAASVRAQNLSSPEEGIGLASRIDAQRRLVQALRQVRATGRIVLDLKPDAAAIDAFPDLTLEDGDRLFVPYAPSTVTVLGAVYNENDFIFKDGRRIRDYLRQSGGPTRSADTGRLYVIRADGSVRGKQGGSGWLNASFEGQRLNPGDTIVLPEKLNQIGFIRNLKDYTQIFSQFALGAAAVNVLR
jgi:protein involved in polysaccharide export with SLBB domain